MKLHPLGALLALLAPAFADAAPAKKKPDLIVAISVDQLSGALYREYRPLFTGGLARLSRGIVYAHGYQAHGVTETCPGHATILTGAHPARSGIVANKWRERATARTDKNIYCAEDERVPGSSSDYTVSPAHLKVPALGDRMKAADPAARVVAVAGKDRSAAMMGGHRPDQRWWWKGGAFVTHPGAAPPPIIARVNASIAVALAKPRPAMAVPAACSAKVRAIDVGGGRTVGNFRLERAAGDVTAFQRSPEWDAATLALAAALTQEMQLGRTGRADLLAIGLSATDYVGHHYGPGGLEMCLQLLTLDQDLERFFELLDRTGVDYAVALTADHGGLDIPEQLRAEEVPGAERVVAAATPKAVGTVIATQLGLPGPAFVGGWYLADNVPPARRAEIIALARKLLAEQPQVASVYSKAEVAAHPVATGPAESWSILDRLRASYDAARSPDLLVTLKENVSGVRNPAKGSVAGHGSPWDYDRNVPILFWRKGMAAEDRTESAMTVDIMPTLASLIALPVPAAEIDGHCLDIIAGAASNCPAP